MLQAMIQELNQEAATTRRVLERIPEDKFGWKPHDKAMTLGQLGLHTAMIPGGLAGMSQATDFDASGVSFTPPVPESKAAILAAHDQGVADAAGILAGYSAEQAVAPWSLVMHGKQIMTMPRVAMLRALLMNHWIHHRGQLSVYLRFLDVPVPSIYGPSGDENPFA